MEIHDTPDHRNLKSSRFTPSNGQPGGAGVTPPGNGATVDLDALKQQIDAREYVKRYMGNGKGGSGEKPLLFWQFPDESTRHKSRSLAVYRTGYKLFTGSGESGDVVDLAMRLEGVDFKQAVQHLIDYAGGNISARTPRQQTEQPSPSEPPSAQWQQTASAAARQAERCLWADRDDSHRALNYLRYGRGLSDATIRRYHLGYTPDWQKLSNGSWLAPGITIPYQVDDTLWALRVRCRVDALADALGIRPDRFTFGDRAGEQLDKYINLKGSAPSHTLFNGDAIKPGADVLIVEGEFDAILAQQELGDRGAVVTFGSASTVPHKIPLRWRDRFMAAGTFHITLDADKAGQEAADKLSAALRDIGKEPVKLALPTGKDVTEYVIDHIGDLSKWWGNRALRGVIQSSDPAVGTNTGTTTRTAPSVLEYAQKVEPTGYQETFDTPLTMHQAALFMVTGDGAENYPMIELHVRDMGLDVFTLDDLVKSTGKSLDAVGAWVEGARAWGAVSEFSEDLRIRFKEQEHILKNAENPLATGGRPPQRFVLTPERAYDDIIKHLPDAVAGLAERGTPATIYSTEIHTADPARTEGEADTLEAVTGEIARSLEALEVVAENERRDKQKAEELQYIAQTDKTPFHPVELPCSVAETRRALWETLYATNPDRDDWRHSEIMWVIGVKQKSVGGVIKRTGITPAAIPTFKDVMLDGKNLYQQAQKACRQQSGAGVAWINASGNVICSLSPRVPTDAAGVKINCGKRYFRRAELDLSDIEPPVDDEEIEIDETADQEQDSPEQESERAQRKARAGMLQRLRGCLRARDWTYVPGPYSHWARRNGDEWDTAANTFEGMIEALLADRGWAQVQRQHREQYADDCELFECSIAESAILTRLA